MRLLMDSIAELRLKNGAGIQLSVLLAGMLDRMAFRVARTQGGIVLVRTFWVTW